jgi:alpha-D-ribose 1-methylphosphonate 5-triphosphate synthase subunit PhnH
MSTPVLTPRAAREQRVFRSLLDAMARPGTVAAADAHPQSVRLSAAVSLLEAVLDHEVTFALVPEQADLIDTLLRLTGSYVAAPDRADYLLCEGGGILRALQEAKEGAPEYPDKNVTVIAAVASVAENPGRGLPLRLAGPGIKDTRTVWVDGFSQECRETFVERNGDLPMGIDLVLAAPDGLFTCLTRYTRLLGED